MNDIGTPLGRSGACNIVPFWVMYCYSFFGFSFLFFLRSFCNNSSDCTLRSSIPFFGRTLSGEEGKGKWMPGSDE